MHASSTRPSGRDGAAAFAATFGTSLVPALMLDDRRRFRDVNAAACLLFRLPRIGVLELRIDDITRTEKLPALQSHWDGFLSHGTQAGVCELMMPDGQRIRAAYSLTANFSAGLHVSVLDPQADKRPLLAEHTGRDEELSAREREILALVALGETGSTIARSLHISIATVETHIRHCLAKLGAKNRTNAVLLALKRGEISLF